VRRRKQDNRATIVDVAALAGVSLGTASRALNNRRGVDPQLRLRVTEAARSLHYVRAANARKASRETCPIISFILSNRDFLHPMHARLLLGAEQYCEERGYFVVFKRLDYSPDAAIAELKLPALLREHGIADCLILAGTNYPNLIEATERAGIPYVFFGTNLVGVAPNGAVDQARSNEVAGAREATRYLVRLGHQRICYIGDISQPWFERRYRAYAEVMAESGLEPVAQTVGLSPDNFHNGSSSAEAVLERGVPITAIFAGSDHIALGAWEQLRRRGLRVPEDISLLGFDDIPDAGMTLPPLTTVHVPFLEIGRELARMAIEKASSPRVALPEVVLPAELVLRGTTWPHLNQHQTAIASD
jgi:LacI family transcriptional regulator, galactose operon repressor